MAPNGTISQNVVTRVAQLPLVSSTYDMMSNMYETTKDNHPYIKSVCEAAEMGVKTITAAAFNSTLPIIGRLEPQISMASDLACKGLDKIEKALPILHQPSGQVVANAKDTVTGTVNGAKVSVSQSVGQMILQTRGMVEESMKKTRMVVSDGVQTVMESKVAHLVSSGLETALSTSENLIENYLPAPEDSKGCETNPTNGFEDGKDEPSYYVRLGSLSTKLRQRAYHKALNKVHDAKKHSQVSISQLNHTMDLIEYTRNNINGAKQKMYEKWISVTDYKPESQSHDTNSETELIESHTLTIARNLTQQLQTTCLTLASSLKGLPQNIQEQALSVGRTAKGIYSRFNDAAALSDLSDSVLTTTRAQLTHMRDSIDDIMDYLINNTPLNWMVGPFYPQMESAPKQNSPCSSEDCSSTSEVEMQTFDREH